MRQDTIDRLLTLNQEFYQSFAEPFSETRGRVQPGVIKAIKDLPKHASILDIGCGNGILANKLVEEDHQGDYIGLDSIPKLLDIARQTCSHPNARFIQKDITTSNWSLDLPGPFNQITAFSVIHHVPGEALRKGIFKGIRRLLSSDGTLTFSVWNFLASPRLRERIIPWDRIDLDPEDLDLGDYLLDWRRGGVGLRYVHAFEPDELAEIAEKTGFRILETYYSDGEGGKLGYYQVWKPIEKHGL
jgi:SAM-dependent methyltransferase